MLSLLKRLFGGGRKPGHRITRGSRNDTAYTRSPAFPSSKPPAVESLDNPDLDIVPTPDTGFDPYNTGTFNRSGSWERINKRRSS